MIDVPPQNHARPSLSTGALCPLCDGARWVCEAHPDRPWGVEGECGCGEPGMPCVCNPSSGRDDPPDPPPGFTSTARRSRCP